MAEVYVALWRVPCEGDSLIGIFTAFDAARDAADNDIYFNHRGVNEAVVELWPLDRAIDFNAQDLPLVKWVAEGVDRG